VIVYECVCVDGWVGGWMGGWVCVCVCVGGCGRCVSVCVWARVPMSVCHREIERESVCWHAGIGST